MKTVAKWNIQLIIKEKIMETHLQLKVAFETYLAEHEKFEQNGVKASSTRARKALMEFTKLAKTRRTEIQDKRNSM